MDRHAPIAEARLIWRDDPRREAIGVVEAVGDFTIADAARLDGEARAVTERLKPGVLVLDLSRLGRLDTAGALVLVKVARAAAAAGCPASVRDPSDEHKVILEEVAASLRDAPAPKPQDNAARRLVLGLGEWGLSLARDGRAIVGLMGASASVVGRGLFAPKRLRFTSLVHQLDRVGFQAIPVIALMSFLIGAIIAQQGAFYFRRFGADVYMVDMVGVLVLREIGVLLTAIMIAGRSGSAFTAEIGAMKMREEIDAMRVIGLDPIEILVVPRVLALIVALPVLTFIADMAALSGAALVAVTYADLPLDAYLERLREGVWPRTFLVGMVKAPFMAFIIAIVACLEGLKVEGSTDSLGRHTTDAVVKAIFLVIVVDGLFAMFFAAVRI